MKAIRTHAVGGPETLTLDEVETPTPGKGEVLVAVKACAINYPDGLFIRDLYQVKWPRPFSPGGEVCGVVEVLGEGVSGLATPGLCALALAYPCTFALTRLPLPDRSRRIQAALRDSITAADHPECGPAALR